jgi:Na+-driven multidrug efflux pump
MEKIVMSGLKNDRLPFGNTKIFLSIASIVLSPVLVGFILGSVSLYLVDKDNKMYNENPEGYDQTALSNHKIGTILSWIGFVISMAVGAVIIYYYYTYGTLDREIIEEIKNYDK